MTAGMGTGGGSGGTSVSVTYSSSNLYVTNTGNQTYAWTSSATVPYGGTSSTGATWSNISNNVAVYTEGGGSFESAILGGRSEYSIEEGVELKITMPNGAVLTVNKDGSYEMVDDGKIIYKGCKVREFNRFINASDLLEEFIRFMGQKFNVKQGEILQIPIELFINWLIIRACQEDGDEIPKDVLRIEDHKYVKRIIPRCKCCGRFIPRKLNDNSVIFCNSGCVDRMIQKISYMEEVKYGRSPKGAEGTRTCT